MLKDNYKTYQLLDFLNDDYFISSLLYPTAESELYWKQLVEAKKINEKAFNEAVDFIKRLKKETQEITDMQNLILWERIQRSITTEGNKKKNREQQTKYKPHLKFFAYGIITKRKS